MKPLPLVPLASRLVALVAGATLLAGCLPSRVVIDLAPRDGELTETAVISDDGANALSPKVALIAVEGVLSENPAPAGLIQTRTNPVDRLVTQLERADADDRVKAVVLRIDSPGGTVSASETLYNELARFRARTNKPIVVSMGGVAASGGYYIALAGDELVAQESTITGSIGVLIQTFNVAEGLRQIGIVAPAVTSGPNKDVANPLEPLRDEQYAVLEDLVDEFYDAFTANVREHRPDVTDWSLATDGRVVTGPRALELGLVDSIGGIREAFTRAKTLADLDRAHLVRYHDAGTTVNSAYARTFDPSGTNQLSWPDGERTQAGVFAGGTQVNLIQVNLPAGLWSTPGVYYLWAGW
ncbi:MAG: signal peptide peptidase SppA [Planctomycetota bacterium]